MLTCFSSTSIAADNRIKGHITPLPHEKLQRPIKLKCGADIVEWRGSSLNRKEVEKICSFAHKKFFEFIKEYKLKIDKNPRQFKWHLSFLPDNKRYRNMNDIKYRFYNRSMRFELTGLTRANIGYTFNISNMNDPQFVVSFVHELFHAMSYHYGLFKNHPGNQSQKIARDEMYAEEFTLYCGLGV